ncbi:MAG: agmatine deiminase family protein [Flavobacteriales bacterium]
MKKILLSTALFWVLLFNDASAQIFTSPPAGNEIRAMAEWEEVQALTIAWTSFPAILKQIVAAARLETTVIILSDDPAGTESYLLSANTGGAAFSDLNNVVILNSNYDSIWMRDYAANPVYLNGVDSLILVDWMYNRPRPNDDSSPLDIANHLGIPLYETSESPYDLRYTGGNYMSDGFGNAFASELILDENDGTGDFNIFYPNHSSAEVDAILHDFMGINTYIKMPVLPYDGIHHIDMHMKLVDEETLLVGEYPEGVADGPQINANIEYVLANFQSHFGTPYRVVRIPMPPSTGGAFPDSNGAYRTYTNAVFVNNTIIFPTYREEYDTTAFRIWGEVCPGYTLVGIDCDNNGNNIISQSGAIHCITHTVGVADPLLISHQPLADTYNTTTPYEVSAYMRHRSGIATNRLYWRVQGSSVFNEVTMGAQLDDTYAASIPAQPVGTIIEYYVQGESFSGKIQTRPMPAPEAFWSFEVLGNVGIEEQAMGNFARVFPNPARAITCIEIEQQQPVKGSILLRDATGRLVSTVYEGMFQAGQSKYFFDAANLQAGVYYLELKSGKHISTKVVVIQ